MKLTNVQQRAVNQTMLYYQEIINGINDNKVVTLKAPTGSGKTFIAANIISNIFSMRFNNKPIICIVGTLSSAELPKAFNKKLNEYLKYVNGIRYNSDVILPPSATKFNESIPDFKLIDNQVYVFGLSSFNKNTLFYQQNTLETFLTRIKQNNYQLIYIRDEAHIGTKKITKNEIINSKKFDDLLRLNADFILEMTATPKSLANIVLITKKELESDNKTLLKNEMILCQLNKEVNSDIELIDSALRKFKEIKEEYKEINIRPCLLIQIDNDANEIKNRQRHDLFVRTLEILEDKIKRYQFNYVKYINNIECFPIELNIRSLNEVSKNDSEVDIVIFKVGPSIGWDIPRACMLLQLRNISSKALNVQTIGRIIRNPMPNLKLNKITDKYYVYTENNIDDMLSYVLKTEYLNKNFIAGRIREKDKDKIIRNREKYITAVKKWIEECKKEKSDFYKFMFSLDEKSLYYNSEVLNSKNIVRTFIPNYLKLKIYNLQNYNDYKERFFLENIKSNIEELGLYFAKKNIGAAHEKVWYLFFSSKFKQEWIKLMYTHKEISNEDYEYSYEKKLISSYQDWDINSEETFNKNNQPIKVNVTKLKKYAYTLFNNGNINQINVSSVGEKEFISNLLSYKKEDINNYLSLICKLPLLPSEIYFDYVNDSNEIKRSFPDFMIQTINKNLMYVEIKNYNYDYDEIKTNNLEKSYSIYSEKNIDKELSHEIKKIFLIILKWNGRINLDKSKTGNFEASYYDSTNRIWVENEIIKAGSIVNFFKKLENKFEIVEESNLPSLKNKTST